MLPESIKKLSKTLSRIPSIGPKSAEKLAVWFAGTGMQYAKELGGVLSDFSNHIGVCPDCGYFSSNEGQKCQFCEDSRRNQEILCLVEQNLDVIDIEEAGAFNGRYFVLGGVISPLEGKTISDLPFEHLKEKVKTEEIKEMIVALGATTEADVTTMYLKELFEDSDVIISVLARGISVGTQIHYAGKKSLMEAFRSRESLKE